MDYVHVYGILHILCLLLMLQGIINSSQGQSCSCSGYGGCNFTNKCVPENNCRKENVALGKPANMSSVWNSSVSACLAVNGNTSTSFYTGGDGKSNCVKSSAAEHYSSWTVDLGQNYTITNITLYTERSYPQVTGDLQVTVDGNLCFQFEFDHNGQERENITCTKPVNGRTVKFYSPRGFYIFVCEVQVWVCIDGYYGNDCVFRCGNCLGEVCDKINGTCPSGCEAGWQNNYCNQECDDGYYGLSCNHTCGKCANFNICNKTTGVCPGGCDSGLTTPYCNQTCAYGTYGSNCSRICGNCTNGEPCDKVSGTCLTCEPGLKPSLCQQVCDNGTYGQNCSSLCGNCTNGEPCDKIKGSCISCKPGLKPPLCQQACDFGTYGHNCSSVRGHCANGEPCDNVNGQCTSCEPGMKPHLCQQTCDNFKYGLNCSNNCGKCTNGEPCDKVNGMCLSCEPGWQIPLCQQEVVTSENSGNTVGAIVGSVLGGFTILGIIIAVPIVIYLGRFKSRSSDSRTKTSTEFQPTSDKSASIKSPTYVESANVESANVESANVYDEMENHYNTLHPIDQREQHNYILPTFEERNVKPAKDKPVYANTVTSDISLNS